MLSVEDLREYCRTCLVKLQESCEVINSKSILIHRFPDVEHIMQVCLSNTVGETNLCLYAPFVCQSCFEKWSEFAKFYQIAINADEKLRKVLKNEVIADECFNTKQKENIIEYFIDTAAIEDVQEIEKYETNSPFFVNIHLDNSTVNNKLEVNSTDGFTQPDGYLSSNSDTNDIDLETKSEKGRVRNKNTQKSKIRKSCALKKNYKTRNVTVNESEHFFLSNGDEGISIEGNDYKKRRYKCKQCNKYFWEKNKYDGHMKQVHEGIRRPYKCEQCDKAYNLYKTLLQHNRECHSEKSKEVFQCKDCDKIFKTGVILKQHLNNKHSEQKEALRSICDQCGFIAAHQYSLSRHIINKHTETAQIKCDQCPKVFKTQYSLKYHVIGNHNPLNIKPFKCSECQMGFSRKTLLNQHKRTHLKYTERIKCDFEGCEVRFVKHGDKTHHMRLVHLKVKQHVCDYCGEAFGAMQTLRHHRFIHTGEKPYKCNVCGQGFRQRTALKTHRKTHLEKEPRNRTLINNLPETNLSLASNLSS